MPVPRGRSQNIVLAADDINCLVYAYLLDSGFEHAAFSLRAEARLDASSQAKTQVERGLLIELLAKALLYTEVETHWREDGVVQNCKGVFSLLRKHVCTLPRQSQTVMNVSENIATTNGHGSKRKSTGAGLDTAAGKRMRVGDSDMMDVDGSEGAMVRAGIYGSRRKSGAGQVSGFGEDHSAVRALPGNNSEVFVCTWSKSDPYSIATGSKDATVRLWDVSTPEDAAEFGSALALWDPPTGGSADADSAVDITCMDWSDDGTLLAAGSVDNWLRIWNKDGTPHFQLQVHDGPVFSCKFSPSSTKILTASTDGSVRLWDVVEKNLIREFKFHKGAALDIQWLNDYTFISSGSDHHLIIQSVHLPVPLKTLVGHKGEVNQIRLTRTRALVVSASDDAKAIVWSVAPYRDIDLSEGGSRPPSSFSWTEEPESAEGQVGLYNPTTTCAQVLSGHDQPISYVAWNPSTTKGHEQNIVATCSFDCTTRLWDVGSGQCLHVIAGHLSKCYTACFSPDGRFVVSGAGDASLFITSVKTGQRLWEWRDTRRGAIFEVSWQQGTPTERGTGRTLLAVCLARQVAIIDTAMLPMLALSM
ncbi:WD40 repeat-like protein [Auriculariales sp. MPI-PUGE-AT-0066]|nr:WD40 repeat-like protein [Auriculariales sp. MPI-PUGE-AT-0066]